MGYKQVIIVEDDLEVSPDFYQYFSATLPILREDKSLWCVSAWNDNGKAGLIDEKSPELLYRTDFFPGLGWMITKGMNFYDFFLISPRCSTLLTLKCLFHFEEPVHFSMLE
jgi:hypothetical protein